jgi:hypothetical protein
VAVHKFVLDPNSALTTLLLEPLSSARRAYLRARGSHGACGTGSRAVPGQGLSSNHVYHEVAMSLLWTLSTRYRAVTAQLTHPLTTSSNPRTV